MLKAFISKWRPAEGEQARWEDRLDAFYAGSMNYHAMTASGDKSTHPQVRYLLEHIVAGKTYAEIGCGSGLVCGLVANKGGAVKGFDVAPIAIGNAIKSYCGEHAQFAIASADDVPLADASVDGVWSFEMLEHVWDPVAALREMVRIVKPGGFVFVTTPNHFSLDLQLPKRRIVRMAEMGCATVRFLQDRIGNQYYVNLVPDILGEDVYPDCDMVSSLIPSKIPKLARTLGCRIKCFSMYRMCAQREGHARPELERYDQAPLLRWYGDHVFLCMLRG